MVQVTSYAHGTFSWVELSTTDLEPAKAFYSKLFAWEPEDMPVPGGGSYTMCKLNGEYVSAMQTMQDEMSAQGHPPFWLSYVTVDDVDEAAGRVEGLGGKVVAPPFDVLDVGRMAIVMDPGKASFALWQAKQHIGAGIVNEPGALCWNELMTNDVDAARGFYTGLFGWTAETQDMGDVDYTVFNRGEAPAAGMSKLTPEMGSIPPSWGVSFMVADVDASAAHLKDLGGTIFMPPTDFPGGRFALAHDPQGAFFGIVTLKDS